MQQMPTTNQSCQYSFVRTVVLQYSIIIFNIMTPVPQHLLYNIVALTVHPFHFFVDEVLR